MALPAVSFPVYELTVPSTKKKIKFRSFLVKEQKSLLLAKESEDVGVVIDTISQIVSDCTLGNLDMESISMFDLEYLMTQIRAKSVGELVELIFSCDTCLDDKAKAKVLIDLTLLQVKEQPDHDKVIPLFNDVGVVMKYPSLKVFKSVEDTENYFDVVASSIDYIYQGEVIYPAKEQTKEELVEFIGNLNRDQMDKIQLFFKTQPKLSHEVTYTCPVCSKEHKKTIEGLQSFF